MPHTLQWVEASVAGVSLRSSPSGAAGLEHEGPGVPSSGTGIQACLCLGAAGRRSWAQILCFLTHCMTLSKSLPLAGFGKPLGIMLRFYPSLFLLETSDSHSRVTSKSVEHNIKRQHLTLNHGSATYCFGDLGHVIQPPHASVFFICRMGTI